MTTEPKGLTDAECRRIRERILMSLNEPRSKYLDRVIRAAYAAGAASVPREPTQVMYDSAKCEPDMSERQLRDLWTSMHDAATGGKG